MKEIPLTNSNLTVLVDDEDFDHLMQWRWKLNNTGYASRMARVNKKTTMILMHRIIINTPSGLVTDHLNHNKLDNRKCNLRACTQRENNQNLSPYRARSDRKPRMRYERIDRGSSTD